MSARAPLDVDLEDKLLYGLTPTRLAYLVGAMLVAFVAWSAHWAPPFLRAAAACIAIGGGIVAAWGRWRGKTVDNWAIDLVHFLRTNYMFALRG